MMRPTGCGSVGVFNPPPGGAIVRLTVLVTVFGGTWGCANPAGRGMVHWDDLRTAPPAPARLCAYGLVTDPAALRPLYQPLGRRWGLIQVRDAEQWAQLARAVSGLGPSPDLQRGLVVGLVCQTGTPVTGDCPVHWDATRVFDGGGLIEARFASGNYRPDGATYLQAVYVEGLAGTLVVSMDGVAYRVP